MIVRLIETALMDIALRGRTSYCSIIDGDAKGHFVDPGNWSIPPPGAKLSDWWFGQVFLSGLTGGERGAMYPKDFTSKGWIKQVRKPLGRASKILGPHGWAYRILSNYQLHGAEGAAAGLQLLRGGTPNAEKVNKIGDKAIFQHDSVIRLASIKDEFEGADPSKPTNDETLDFRI